MLGTDENKSLCDPEVFDYSTPEAQLAMTAALDLVLEIREDTTGPMARRLALYEKTLGLAVIPVLARRAFIAFLRTRAQRREILR